MILNPIDIVKEINNKTPKCVLDDLNLIVKGNYQKFSGWNISKKYTNNKKDLQIIARLLNPKHQWKRKALLTAFNFYLDFSKNPKQCFNDFKKIKIGWPSSEQPQTFTNSMLYRLCYEYGIQTDKKTTNQEMLDRINLFFTGSWLPLQKKLLEKVRFGSKKELVNLAITLDLNLPDFIKDKTFKKTTKPDFTYEQLELASAEIGNQKIEANNDLDAIILAARDYKLDFTLCESPLQEYKNLVENGQAWCPQNSLLKQRLSESLNRPYMLTNPRLNEKFNGHLPGNMYYKQSNEILINLCQEKGIEIGPEDNPYDELQISCLAQTFYHGKQGNIVNSQTTFWEEFSELDHHEVLIYGVAYNIDNPMTGFTYGELYDTFDHYDKFINPRTKEIFSQMAINKLQKICEHSRWFDESEKCYKERQNLAAQIEKIKIYNSSKNHAMNELIYLYENLSEKDQKKVNEIFINLLNCGMYMRNWDGKGDYPLESIQTNFPPSEQINVDHRVTQSLIELEKSCQALPELSDYILDLPLMQYNRASGVFTHVTNSNEGLTIRRRIAIVRKGENEDGVTSCIRLSSNKFCASAYYYMILLGFRLPFKISEVSHIF
jgi:hypothetical protein